MKKNDKNMNNSSEIEINIIPLLKELLRKLWLIVLAGVLVSGVVFMGARLLVKPTYRSGFTAYVNNKQSKQNTDYLTASDVNAAKELVLTYRSIITSNSILTAAAESIGVDRSYESLAGRVSTEIKDETEIISVYVVDSDPQFAYDYAQAISKTAPQYMAQIVEGSSMKIIDYPEYSEKRYRPIYSNYAIFGFLIGALLVTVILAIRYFVDDTVKSESELESKFTLPILGVIPDISKATNRGSDYYYYENKSEAEPVETIESEQQDEKNKEK